MDWLNSVDEEKLFITVTTVGEIQHGIERLPDSHRKTGLLVWMNNGLLERFSERMVALDEATLFIVGVAHCAPGNYRSADGRDGFAHRCQRAAKQPDRCHPQCYRFLASWRAGNQPVGVRLAFP